MLLGRLHIRGKLAVLVVIPLMAVVALAIPVVLDRVERAGRAADTVAAVRVAGRVGALAQDVQLERMLSVGFLVGTVDRTRLEQQVTKVTSHATQLRTEGTGGDSDPRLPRRVREAIERLDQLAPLRASVLDKSVGKAKLIAGYSQVVASLIDSLALERSADPRTSEGIQVMALDASMRTDELITVSAAYLVVAAASGKPQDLAPYSTTLAMLDSSVGRLTALASPAQLQLYLKAQASLRNKLGAQFTTTVTEDVLKLINQLPLPLIYAGLEGVVGPGRVVSDQIIADVTDEITDQRHRELTTAYLVGGLSGLVLLLVIALSLAVGRSVVVPLTRLTRSAERVAKLTEEELTRVADGEEESAEGPRLDPIGDAATPGEIGDLARAFARVQGTAADLVERQVVSRRNVAQMFGHVGRRTQNLVSRQIAIIDRLESKETDPNRLQQLYRLDHVSSRLRRNAGSLVVLSGGTSANEHVNPLPLGDVTRLALGEIEDYTRVDVLVPPDLTLVPAAIGDAVLMLAELMENATVFSPPHTRVTVNARITADGAQLAVVDHGIGLSAEQLAQENSRLERRERLDLAPTGVLGLFVVGRLARRNGLRVLLGATPGGGVTATVDIPRSLLASSPALPGPTAGRPPSAGPTVASPAVVSTTVVSPAVVSPTVASPAVASPAVDSTAVDSTAVLPAVAASAAPPPAAGPPASSAAAPSVAVSPADAPSVGTSPASPAAAPSAATSSTASLSSAAPTEVIPRVVAPAAPISPAPVPPVPASPAASATGSPAPSAGLAKPGAPAGEQAALPGSAAFNQAAVSRASRSIATGTSWSAFVPHQHDTADGSEAATGETGQPDGGAGAPAPAGNVGTSPVGTGNGAGTPVSAPGDGGGGSPPGGGTPAVSMAEQPTAVIPVVTAEAARSLVENFEAGVRRAQVETQILPVVDLRPEAAPPTPAGPPPAAGQPLAPAAGQPLAPPAAAPPPAGTPLMPAPPAGPPPASGGMSPHELGGTTVPIPIAHPGPGHPEAPDPARPLPAPASPVPPETLAPAPLPRPVTAAPAPLARRRPGATLEGQPEFTRSAPVVASGAADPDEARMLVEQFEAGVFRALGEVRSQHQPEEGSRQ